MRTRKLIFISALTLALAPASAHAQDWFFTPFVGANFGGAANFEAFNEIDDEIERRIDFGATIGWQPAIVGLEVDFGWTPNFFEDTVGDRNFGFGDSRVTTLMGNLLVGAPAGYTFRPYASGGLGLISTAISDIGNFGDLTDNDFGVNLGGGVNGQFNDTIGIRGDVRYFRSLQDDEPDDEFDVGFSDFEFWRGTVGVTFRW